MIYQLTPAERRAREFAVRQQRQDRIRYNQYLRQKEAYERQLAEQKLQEEQEQREKESQSFLTRSLHTIGDIASNVITGAAKGLEGIYDLGAGIVGAVGGLFDKDFQDRVKDRISYDWTMETFGNDLQDAFKYSYTKDGGIIEGVASGVGQMLPAVLVTAATLGAGAPATAAQTASLVAMGTSAAGNATEEAFNDGADYYKGLGYGAASGAVEMATEKMFGGFGKLTGAGYLDNVTKSVAKQGIARVAKEAVEEGAEEMASEAVSPALKTIYKGKDAFVDYDFGEHLKDIGKAGVIGGLTSMAYGQTIGRVMHTSGKYADVNGALSEMETLRKKAQNLSETGRLYERNKNGKVNSDIIRDSMVENLHLVEQIVKSVDESKRESFIKKAKLTEIVNSDGSIKPEFAASRGVSDVFAQQSVDDTNAPQSPLASQPKQYRTAFTDDKVLQKALDKGNAKPFVGTMTEEQAADFNDFTKAFGKLSNKSGGRLKFVVAENMEKSNAYVDQDSGVVVIGADQFGKGTSGVELTKAVITSEMWQKSAIHEVKHSTEGTKNEGKLNKHLLGNNEVLKQAVDEFVGRGYFGEDRAAARKYLNNLIKKVDDVANGKSQDALTANELKDYQTAQSEITAMATENVLGNEDFINNLVRNNTTFAERILNLIEDTKEAFASLKSKEARAAYNYAHKAANYYLKAIKEAGGKYEKRRIIGIRNKDEGETIDGETQTEYNENAPEIQQSRRDSLIYHTFPTYKEGNRTQANELATRWAKQKDVVAGDRKLISYEGRWYVIQKFDDSDYGYQIMERIDSKHYQSYLEEYENVDRQKQSIQKISSGITSLDRRGDSVVGKQHSANSSYTRLGEKNSQVQRVGEEQSQSGQTSSNRNGDSEGGSSSEQGIKRSLKDSQGRTLTEAQQKFFAESKARDSDGNLMVVYHGTEGEFYTYDKALRGTNTGARDAKLGFFFTSNYDVALDYAAYAQDNKVFTLMYKIANGDKKILDLLSRVDGYKELEVTSDLIEYEKLIQKAEEGELDVQEVFLNIKNPYEEDWKGKDYKKGAMLRVVTKALLNNHDGVIIRNIEDSVNNNVGVSDVFVVFESNQIKLTTNINPTENDDIRFSRKVTDEKSQWKQMSFLADYEKPVKEWDEYLTTTAEHNLQGLLDRIDELNLWKGDNNGSQNIGGDGRGFSLEDRNNIRRIFTRKGELNNADSKLYEKFIKAVKGFTTTEFLGAFQLKAIDADLYTYNMARTVDVNAQNNIDTVFYLGTEYVNLHSGRTQNALGFFWGKTQNTLYVSVEARDKYVVRGKTEVDYRGQKQRYVGKYIVGTEFGLVQTSPITTARHERLHLLINDIAKGIDSQPQSVRTAVTNLYDFVRNNIGGRSVNEAYSYVKSYYQQIYSGTTIDNIAEEISCELYAHCFVFQDESLQSEVQKYIDAIDKTLQNVIGQDNIRYSRKSTDGSTKQPVYQISKGQVNKLVANGTRMKVYSKMDAERIIVNVLNNQMDFEDKYGDLSGKSREEVISQLWQAMNSAEENKQLSVALDIADCIIRNATVENLFDDYEDAKTQQARDILCILRPYLHNVNLDAIKADIAYRFDKDKSPYAMWGRKKGTRGVTADQIATELEASGVHIDAVNEADIFFEIYDVYHSALQSVKKKTETALNSSLTDGAREDLRQKIAKEILHGFDYTGKESNLSKVVGVWQKKVGELRTQLREAKQYNRAVNSLLYKTQKIRDWKTGAFVNASKFKPNLFKGSIEKLGQIKNRGNLNQSGTRRIVAGLAEWYSKDNPMLGYVNDEHPGQYNAEIDEILQAVAQNQKPLTEEQADIISALQKKLSIDDYKGLAEWYTQANLKKEYDSNIKKLLKELTSETTFTTEEIVALEKVVGYFGHLIENYNKVVRNGKYVDAKPLAEKYVNTLWRNKNVKVGCFGRLFEKTLNNQKASYLQTFADPMTVARYMDKYESGFYTEILTELRDGAIRASVTELQIRMPLEEFLKKHKNYGREVSKRTVTYKGVEMPALDAMLLYMTLNREQALVGLAESGFMFNNGKESVRVDGFAEGKQLTLEELREMAKAEQEELIKQLTELDKEYILIAEKIFNEDCREAKRATDMLRMGYSNVFDGYYVPIRRANGATTVDASTFFDEMNRVSNASFNKDTVQNARELRIEGLDTVLDRHIHGVSQYAGLATVIDQYDILYNLNMSENANKPITVQTEGKNTWTQGDAYFKKLMSDIQGISPTRGGGSKAFGFLRSSYAKYQLGLNPKVWVTQLSSLFASSSILDVSSIIKGFGIKAMDVDDYCSIAAVRNNDNSAAMAQGVLDKVDRFGNLLMKPIGIVDRFVIKKLFGACQAQVEKESGLKVGTQENKVKAGELLQRVILETQQNSIATERSAAMRSGSELMKTLTMFTADSMKVFGRVVDTIGEVSALKARLKTATDPKEIESLKARLKQANKKARKSIAALVTSAVFMALVAQAFRWLYNKDDEDENALETIAVDAVGNLMGGLPLIKDLYAKLTEGYDLNNYAYSSINDLFDAFASIVNFSEGKPAQKIRSVVYAAGQLLGLPTRNVYNIIYGLTKRFSSSAAYEWDSHFYNKNYSSDLQKAIENDDEKMIATIAGIMTNEKVGDIESEQLKKELNKLVSAGYKVLPRSIGDSITYDGEEIALTTRQKKQFKSEYFEATDELASLVESKVYQSASDEVKAKAVSFIWNIYYNLAIEDLLGVELETKNILFAKAVDVSSLAIIVATARGLEADIDRKGNVVSGSKKAKVQKYVNSLRLTATQKYMIMGYLGYSNKYGENLVRRYIQSLRMTKAEKEKLLEYSGYSNRSKAV